MTETNGSAEQPADQPPPQAAAFQPPQAGTTQPPPAPTAQYPSPQYPTAQYGAAPTGYPNPNAPYGGYGQQYGAYGAGPYSYPQGYYAQPPGTNGIAIASLVLGICGFFCVTPFISIPLGFVALSKVRATGQSGRGMAIAGIVLSAAWIALLIALIAVGHFHFDVGTGSNNGPSVVQTQDPNGTSA